MTNETYESAKQSLLQNGEFSNMTTGKSMFPMLRSGRDIVVIKPPVFPLKKYDVPLYRREGFDKLILHRIIKAPQNGVYTVKGDNTYYTETVREEDIVGVLDGFFRKGRYHNCKSDKKYRAYIYLMRFFYPARYLWSMILRPALGKIKRAVIKK